MAGAGLGPNENSAIPSRASPKRGHLGTLLKARMYIRTSMGYLVPHLGYSEPRLGALRKFKNPYGALENPRGCFRSLV